MEVLTASERDAVRALSFFSGTMALVSTSVYLVRFWKLKGIGPWWTLVVPVKKAIPYVRRAHAHLNRECTIVELNTTLLVCLYQLQAVAVVSGGLGIRGVCEAQAFLFQWASLASVFVHGVVYERMIVRLVVFCEPSSSCQRRFRRWATTSLGSSLVCALVLLGVGHYGAQESLEWCWISGRDSDAAHAYGAGLWILVACGARKGRFDGSSPCVFRDRVCREPKEPPDETSKRE